MKPQGRKSEGEPAVKTLSSRRVTLCRDARSERPLYHMRPLYQRLQHRGFNGDGRTDRASLQRVTRLDRASLQRRGYSCRLLGPIGESSRVAHQRVPRWGGNMRFRATSWLLKFSSDCGAVARKRLKASHRAIVSLAKPIDERIMTETL